MRLLNRPLAFILAAALIAGSVVVIAEVIGSSNQPRPTPESLRSASATK
jgi:hypothetical protein